MKLDARRLPGFLRDPGACRVVLLHGTDLGLIRSRADTLTRAVLGGADDPFRLAWLDRDEVTRLEEEATALALTGGRRVVRVREAGDSALGPLERALAAVGDTLIILEAGELPSRSRLRMAIEKMDVGAAIGCYPEEGRALAATIRATLASHGVSASDEVLDWLSNHLGSDQAGVLGELEKAALLVGDGGTLELEAAQHCIGDLADASLEDALFGATEGDLAQADRALALALAQGASPVGVIRGALAHLQRLHRARLAIARGASTEEAVRSLRPPLFFRRTGAFTRALGLWSPDALLHAIADLGDAERACKRTGAPDDLLCQRAVSRIAAMAASRKSRAELTPA